MDRLIHLQRFDRYILDGSVRPEGAEPDYEHFVPETMGHFFPLYSENHKEREWVIKRDCYFPFLNAIREIASLTHSHGEFEVLGRFAEKAFVDHSPEHMTEFKRLFIETDELQGLRNVMAYVKDVALAKEESRERAEIRELEREVTNALGDGCEFSTLLDHGYETYLVDIRSKLGNILDRTPVEFDTRSKRFVMTHSLIDAGEVLKLAPKRYRNHQTVRQLIKFRDKAIKILPRRLGEFGEEGINDSYAACRVLLTSLREWVSGKEGVVAPAVDPLVQLREYLGYNGSWRSRARNEPIPDPDMEFLRAGTDLIREEFGRDRVKSLKWEHVANSVGPLLSEVSSAIDAFAAQQSLRDGTDPLADGCRRAEIVRDLWGKILSSFNVEVDDTLDTLLERVQTQVRSFPERLWKHAGIDVSDIDEFGDAWGPIRGFTVTHLTRIRANLQARNLIDPACLPSGRALKLMVDHAKLSEEQLSKMRLIGLSMLQSIQDYNTTFERYTPYFNMFRKMRNYWSHSLPGTLFPEVVEPYTMRNTEQSTNELNALAGLYLLLTHCFD